MTEKKPAFWMVWGEGQRGSQYAHHSLEAATHEARRLAREHHGIRFFVLEAKRGYVVADPVSEIEIDNDPIPF